jgi:hypothetical protein
VVFVFVLVVVFEMADLVGFGRSALVAMVVGLVIGVAWRWLRKYAAARKGAATRSRRKMSPDSMVENGVVPMFDKTFTFDDDRRSISQKRKAKAKYKVQSTCSKDMFCIHVLVHV